MHELYELRDKLCDELKEQGRKGISSGTIGTIDTLAHAIKNVDKIIECDEGDEYSGRAYPDGMGVYRHSYARGRMGAPRDRMGRYSGERGYSRNTLADKMRDLMMDAPDDRTRQEIQRMVEKLEA